MATILTKKSDTASAVPGSGDLTNSTGGAELAVNTADKRIYTKNSGGTVVELGTNPSTLAVDGTTLVVDATNDRVGIGTASPSRVLHVNSGTTDTGVLIESADAVSIINMKDSTSSGDGISFGVNGDAFIVNSGLSTERMRIDSSGNVGIGTTSPVSKFNVVGNSVFEGYIQFQGTSTFPTSTTNPYIGRGANGYLEIGGRQTSDSAAYISFKTVNAERMRIDSSGNVGIGTSSPSAKLHVQNQVYIKGTGGGDGAIGVDISSGASPVTTSAHQIRTGGGAGDILFIETQTANSNGQIVFQTNGSERIRIDSSGNVSITQAAGKYTIDVTGGSTVMANGGTIDFPSASGMWVINNYTNGVVSIILAGAGTVYSVASVAGALGGAITYNSGVNCYRFTNNSGSTAQFGFFFIRTRPNA